MAFASFHGLMGVPLTYEGSVVYPGSGEDPWALDLLPANYRHFSADLLITVMDAWVLDAPKLAGMNLAHWMPVDCEPLGAMDRRVLDAAGGRPVAMSRFGERMLRDAGYDPLYAPHALDMGEVWKPLADREAARRQLGLHDRFVIGINAANQDPFRKAFGEQVHAFAAFVKKHDDALMLIHARAETRQGVNLNALIAGAGLTSRHVMLGDQYMIAAGLIGDAQMASWHGICDFGSNFSYGEGFGLAVLQFQATGTPVGVTDCSSMSELCGAGYKARGQSFWNRGHDARWMVPSVTGITKAYEKAYGQAAGLRGKARQFAVAYDADRVYARHWGPALKELLPAPGASPVLAAAPGGS